MRFLGWLDRPRVMAWLAHASLLVFPSHGPESLSRVLLEAAAIGVPIAAMNTGGTGDIIEHGVSGLLSSTPDELGDHVARLASDRELAASLARRARAARGRALRHGPRGRPLRGAVPGAHRWTSHACVTGHRRADGLRVAVLTRAVTPLHGVGGLERSTLRPRAAPAGARRERRPLHAGLPPTRDAWAHDGLTCHFVPYRTFPGAGRRGTTILDRSTAYPVFGYRLGRAAAAMAAAGQLDVVHGLGASTLGYAAARRRAAGATVPLVLNPQGLEEFGGIDGSYGGRPSKRLAYEPLRRAVRYCAGAADRIIATDRALEPMIARALGVGADRMRLVPNAVDLRVCGQPRVARPTARGCAQQAGIGADDVVLLSVGEAGAQQGAPRDGRRPRAAERPRVAMGHRRRRAVQRARWRPASPATASRTGP
ncbi:MAG: glycosyltransferase [Ignavibacteriales bacterium]|nr:glycosyltransferase [Ignavibacteriales bacterium]